MFIDINIRMCYLIKGCWDFEKDVVVNGYLIFFVGFIFM